MPGIEKTKSWCRKRVADPKRFDRRSFRIKQAGKNTYIVVGCPKGKYNRSKCSVGMKIQSIRKRRFKNGRCPKI